MQFEHFAPSFETCQCKTVSQSEALMHCLGEELSIYKSVAQFFKIFIIIIILLQDILFYQY